MKSANKLGKGQVSNYLIKDGIVRVDCPLGGQKSFADGSSEYVGAIKIKLPVLHTNTRLRFLVDVYDYASEESFSVLVGGFNYNPWVSTFAQIISTKTDRDFNIRFGDDGTSTCIWIGETNSTWDTPIVSISNFVGGGAYIYKDWADNWDITIEQTLDTVNVTHSNNLISSDWSKVKDKPPIFSDGTNVGVGISSPYSILQADKSVADNSPYKNIFTVSAHETTEGGTDEYDPANPSFGINFRRRYTFDRFSNEAAIYSYAQASWRGGLIFSTKSNTSQTGSPDPRMIITPSGKVGVGKLNPLEVFDVEGGGAFSGQVKLNGGATAPTPVTPTDDSKEVVNVEYLHGKLKGSTGTGTLLSLAKTAGTNYGYTTPLSDTTYTTENPVLNGYASVKINAASEPTVTGGTKISGADFVADTDMEMVVESKDGTNVRYFFLAL